IQHDSPYSIDQNLWGRSNECGILEDPYAAPPKDAFDLTNEIEDTPDEADEVVLTFEQGLPTALNGKSYKLRQLILDLNKLAGRHGIERIDYVGNSVVRIRLWEV